MNKIYYVKWYEGGYEETEHFSDYLDALDFIRQLEENGTVPYLQELKANGEWDRVLA